MRLVNEKRFSCRTEKKYKCLDGYHEMEYQCYYLLSKEVDQKRVTCEFTTYFPVFGYEKIYGHGGLEETEKLKLLHLDLDVFSGLPKFLNLNLSLNICFLLLIFFKSVEFI